MISCGSFWMLLMLLAAPTFGQDLRQLTCTKDNSVTIQPLAKAFLGGVISISNSGEDGYGCAEPFRSMQAYESIRWVLELLNKVNDTIQTEVLKDYYVPGITLGMKVIDNCNKDQAALAALGNLFPELLGDADECKKQNDGLMFGLVGGSSSGTAVKLSEAAEQFNIPVVSFEATATDLALKHSNFMRTISPDGPMMEVIVKVLFELEWKYITIVYQNNVYGRKAYSEFHSHAVAASLCVTAGVIIERDNVDNSYVDGILDSVSATKATGVVYFGMPNFAKALIQRADMRKTTLGKLQWIFVDFPLDETFLSTLTYQHGIITVTTATRLIVEFEDHWIRLDEANPPADNPWYQRWYEKRHNCAVNPPGNLRECKEIYAGLTEKEKETNQRVAFQQDQYVEPAVMAVYTYANALRRAQMDKCGNVPGTCTALIAMTREEFYTKYVKTVDLVFTTDERVPSLASKWYQSYNSAKRLSFTTHGDIDDISYFIWNYNNVETGVGSNDFKFRRVGTYINKYLDLNLNNVGMYNEDRTSRLKPLPSSLCLSTDCSPCLGLPAEVKYYYEPGDLVLSGLFSLHNMGLTSLTCGVLKSPNQVMYLEAMIYAIKRVNNDPNVLGNIKLGGLGMDDCSNIALGQAFIAQVQRGQMQIMDAAGQNQLDPFTVEAYTGAHTSTLTISLAKAMNWLKRPLVGYRAGSSELDDRTVYPYYIRALPGMKEEILAIILLLKNYGWMHVQVVTSNTHYSQDAEPLFRKLAAKEGICVVALHNLGNTMSSTDVAVKNLAHSSVMPTVALLDTMEHGHLLKALKDNPSVKSGIALIATSRWMMNKVANMTEAAEGVITLGLRHSSLMSFSNYLKGLRIDSHKVNPWFMEWYTQVYSCAVDGFPAGKPVCDIHKSVNDAAGFELMYEVDSVINSVQAIARALSNTLAHFCGTSYTHVCSTFSNSANKGKKFMEELGKVSFPIEDMQNPNTFTFKGPSGAIGFEIFNLQNDIYKKVGDVNPWDKVIQIVPNSIKLTSGQSPIIVQTSCSHPCLECLYTFNHQDYLYIPGDLMIGAIFNIHHAGSGPFSCGAFHTVNGALYSEALAFAVDRINKRVPVFPWKLGVLGFDGCKNPARALAIINRAKTNPKAFGDGKISATDFVAWITYDSETTAESAMLLQKLGVPSVTPGATLPALADMTKYSTLFRTVPSDDIVAKGMAQFADLIGWRYVLILNAPDASSRASAHLFRKYAKDYSICVLARYEFETDGNLNVILDSLVKSTSPIVAVFAEPDQHIQTFLETKKNNPSFSKKLTFIANRPWAPFASSYNTELSDSVFFGNNIPNIAEFATFLRGRNVLSSDNPWLADIFEELLQCNLPGSFDKPTNCLQTSFGRVIDSGIFHQDMWTLSTINAVFAIGEGLHLTLNEKCSNTNTSVCHKFVQDEDTQQVLMKHMDAIRVKSILNELFYFVKRGPHHGYKFQRYTNNGLVEQEGDLTHEGQLSFTSTARLMRTYLSVKASCPEDCLICRELDSDFKDFSLTSGNVYIVGMFDVHKQGSTPFTCGEVNDEHGMQLLEAFHYAIDYVNSRKGMFANKLDGFQLGGIGLDTCMSPARAANLVANIHSGNFELTKGGKTINIRRVDAYVATMATESSIRVADILTQLQVPQISYGATGMDLLNSERYSYFLRSVPADDKQARAVISYLKKFNYNNIQLINSFDEIGEPGAKEFERLSEVNLVCITKKYMVGEMGNHATDANKVISLVQQQTNSEVVVLWMKNPLPVLEAASRNIDVRSRVLFIATDKWGANPHYLTNPSIRSLLLEKNLVILDVETADIPEFDKYLESRNPDTNVRNPWFMEYYEKQFSCSWSSSVQTGKPACDQRLSIPRTDHYVQDPYVLYVINAVFSAAMAIDSTIKGYCVQGNSLNVEVCNLYRTSGERRQKVLEHLKKVRFVDDTYQPFFYTEDGQSDRGFHIYKVASNGNTFAYQNIGSYNDTDFLKLDIRHDSDYKARCNPFDTNSVDKCTCPFKVDLPTRFMKTEDGGRGLTLAYVGDIHKAHPNNKLACGPINTGIDLHHLMAFFYAIERINTNAEFNLPDSIRLDGVALDSCSKGLRLGQDVYNLLSGNQLCDTDEPGLVVKPSSIAAFIVDKNHNAISVSSMLTQQGITSISPTAGHSVLDDPYQHPYFMRTIGGDAKQAKVMLDVAKAAAWDLLTVVYSDSMAQQSALDNLLEEVESRNKFTCIGDAVKLPMSATLTDAANALEKVTQQVGMRVVILFVEHSHLRLLMEASRNLRLTRKYIWVLGAQLGSTKLDLAGLESELEGAIMIQDKSAILSGFVKYFGKLSFTNRMGIPDDWFEEIYESLHKCSIFNWEKQSPKVYTNICTQKEKILPEMIPRDKSVLHVIMAVYSAALGLSNIPVCAGNQDIAACLNLKLKEDKSDLIYRGIQKVNFQVFPNELRSDSFDFTFDLDGNGEGGYSVLNFQLAANESTVTAHEIGRTTTQGLEMDWLKYEPQAMEGNTVNLVNSNCVNGSTCICRLKDGRSIRYSPSKIYTLENVQVGRLYRKPDTGEPVLVEGIPGVTDRFDSIWAIIMIVLATTGASISLLVFVYLLVMYPVRGGTSIVGYMLSFGIVLLYLMVFPFIAHADERICSLRRFALGLVYAIVYSSLLVKMVDCWRLRNKDSNYNVIYSKLGRPLGLFFVIVFLVLVQVMINTEWLILEHPNVERVFYNNLYWPRCAPDDFYDQGLVLSLTYVMVLIFCSFLIGIATFTATKNHRESRWIMVICSLSIPCWVIWCLVAIMGDYKVRDAAVAVGLLINATVILLFVPLRKLYLLCKYSKLIEEEEKLTVDQNSTYGHQYDNTPRLHDTGSMHGSSVYYAANPSQNGSNVY